MRKILHKETKKDVKKKQLLLGGILIFILVFSTFGLVFQNSGHLGIGDGSGETVNYNGFEFLSNNGLWLTQIGNSVLVFSNNPSEVEPLNGILNPLGAYYANDLYFNSQDYFSTQVIQNNFGLVALSIQESCLENSECLNEDLQKVNCNNNFISIEVLDSLDNSRDKIVQSENCVFIKGTAEEIPLLLDQFFLRISGIN